MSDELSYTPTAERHLDDLERGSDADLYNAVLDACEMIFDAPGTAQRRSPTAITTKEGIRLILPVVEHAYWVYWSPEGPRIEAILPAPG